jgi:aspartate racemase
VSTQIKRSVAVLDTGNTDDAHHLACSINALSNARMSTEAHAPAYVIKVDGYRLADAPVDHIANAFALFDAISTLDFRSTETVTIPDLACYGFFAELAATSPIPVVDIGEAIVAEIRGHYPSIRTIALLSDEAPDTFIPLARRCATSGLQLVHTHVRSTEPIDPTTLLRKATLNEATLILPATNALARRLKQAELDGASMAAPILDIGAICARHALRQTLASRPSQFKLGVLGGVGPAATVSFLDKLVRATPASRDQDHLKVVVEQNPQIPDRTDHLVNRGPDPTLALYATCRRLELAHADAIAIPCNTAHAFVERIQPALTIPIVHMLKETVAFIASRWPRARRIGLLATDGTLQSRVYHQEAEAAGLAIVAPSIAMQLRVMAAIYGPDGVKAGHVSPSNHDAILDVIAHLADLDADAVILGCTELPLLVPQDLNFTMNGRGLPIVDPSDVLARRCIEMALASAPPAKA